MNLKEHIRKVLEEEISMRTSERDYTNLIKKTVLDYVDFDLCKLVVKKINNTKDEYFVIMMVDQSLKTSYREELQDYLNDMIPLTIYVSIADGMGCKKFMGIDHPKQLSESKIPPQVLRRHHLIDEMFNEMRIRYKRLFCNYRNPNILLGVLYERTLSDLYHAWFSETVSDDDWDYASEYIQKYLIDKYEKETIHLWDKRCNEGRSIRETKDEVVNEMNIKDMFKNMFGKKPLTKDDRLIDVLVKFIKENYLIDFSSNDYGEITYYETDYTGVWNTPIMKYYPKYKRLEYSRFFAEDIYNTIGDNRLLQPDSEIMGKIFEKLYKKKVDKANGYRRI
jgi:hypothetical protein